MRTPSPECFYCSANVETGQGGGIRLPSPAPLGSPASLRADDSGHGVRRHPLVEFCLWKLAKK